MGTVAKIQIAATSAAWEADDTFGSWTNLLSTALSATEILLDFSDGTDTGWDITIDDAPQTFNNAGVIAVGTGDAAWVDEAIVSRTSHFVDKGDDNLAIYRLSGLNNSNTYTIKVFASRDTSGPRDGDYSIDAFSSFINLEAAGNSTDIAEFASVSPSSGAISISVRVGSGDFAYINAIEIEEFAGGGSTLTADSGAYSYTGTANGLLRGLALSADTEQYTYSGTDAGLLSGAQLDAETAQYTYSGTSADLLFGANLAADSGTYTYSGTDATLTFTAAGNFTLVADTGAYTYSGTNADLLKSSVLVAETAQYTYSGTNADLLHGFNLTADSGSYTYAGTAADFSLNRVITMDNGAYLFTGTAVTLTGVTSNIWTDQAKVATIWTEQTNISTTWTPK